MKIYTNQSVLQASLDRISLLFEDFAEVVVCFSGGKDSTVLLNLVLQVAEQKNRLPVSVMFIDQEAEWQGTVDYIEGIMNDSRVKPYWYQIPMYITNNASNTERYSYCWNPDSESEWMRLKSKISIKENNYGTMRFHDLFAAIAKTDFTDNTCFLSGVRAEEAPKRLMSLTHKATYKWITWGKILNKSKNQISFYPIYDWLYSDIWKAIHEHAWSYNRIYDQFYRYGASIPQMRVSNLHHETALHHIMQVQDIEPETWSRLQSKISGANTIKHLKDMAYECPKELPYMFESWKEYAYYLIENLIQNESNKQKILDYIIKCDNLYDNSLIEKTFYRTIINTVLSSDWDLTKISNFEIRQETNAYRQFKRGVYKSAMIPYVKYLTAEEQQILQNEVKKQYDQSQ